MRIVDYDSLKEELIKWTARTDTAFSNRIDAFVALAEDRIYNGSGDGSNDPLYSKPLRVSTMEVREPLSVVDGEVALPSTVLDLRSAIVVDQRYGLEYLEPERFAIETARLGGGSPLYYTVDANTLKLAPGYTGNVDILFYKRFDPISSTNLNGELIAAHGMLYLNAALFEAFSWIQEESLALGHLARYRSQVHGLNSSAKSVRHGGKNRRIRTRVPMP